MDINFRLMNENDLTFFNNVRNKSVEFLHDKTMYTINEVKKWYSTTKNQYFIVNIDSVDIGYFRTSEWLEDSCYIGMDIHPKYRGNGFAQKAYPLFIKYLYSTKGLKTFFLEVLQTNERAIHIYKKLGFKVIFENAINMKMELIYDNKKL